MKYLEILAEINGNGGFDMRMIEYRAKQSGITVREYLYELIKDVYKCHGNTANKVVSYLI